MSGRGPGPRSPERLSLASIDGIEAEPDRVLVTVTFEYEAWGDGDIWDVVHAVNAVHRMAHRASERAYARRIRRLAAEVQPEVPPGYDRVRLEHTDTWLLCHGPDRCMAQVCSLHARTDHRMRSWPQHWRADRYLMERVCPHGVGHPDPDDFTLMSGLDGGEHGCDGCCGGAPVPALTP